MDYLRPWDEEGDWRAGEGEDDDQFIPWSAETQAVRERVLASAWGKVESLRARIGPEAFLQAVKETNYGSFIEGYIEDWWADQENGEAGGG